MKGTVMTTTRVSILLAAAVALGSATAVQAADLYGGTNDNYFAGSIKDAPMPPPSHRSVYVKGYIGMHNHEIDTIDSPVFANGFFTIGHTDMKSAPFFGLGIGVDTGRWLRFDVTGEYRGKWLFIGQDSYDNGLGCPGAAAPGVNCGTNEYTADIEGWVGLANAYVDLGTWRGITPYVGAGIGFGHYSVEGLKDVNVPAGSVFFAEDNSETNFAWAIHAGFSYDVTDRVTLDLGYRYLNVGDISSGRVTAFDGSSSYTELEIEDVESHDLMLGVRFSLDEPAHVMPVSFK